MREMTVKAGQKCTAIRRIIVPDAHGGAVIEAISERLAQTVIGDPRDENVRMGALASLAQTRRRGGEGGADRAGSAQVFGPRA